MTASTFLLSVLTLALGQAPADVTFTNQRSHSIPVNFPESRRAEIRELLLYASQDQGETWSLTNKIAPEQNEFVFAAPVDGAYWLRVAVVDRNGRQEPDKLHKVQPSLRMTIDTLKPLLRFVSAQRSGNEIAVAWEVREDHPDWTSFRLEYQPTTGGLPVPINAAPGLTGQARFTPNTNAPIAVRLTLKDRAGNESIVTEQVGGLDVVATASLPAPTLPVAPAPPLPPPSTTPPPAMPAPSAQLPAALTQAPLPPADAIGTTIPGNPSGQPLPPSERGRPFTAERPAPLLPVGANRWNGASTASYQPAPTERPIASTEFTPPAIVPVQHQVAAPSAAPRKPLPTLQYVNSPEVVLEYELSKVGPSGVGSVDIYLTQDDGQAWEHVATDPAVVGKTTGGRHKGIVELPGDGVYGFTLVVKSQAQLKQEGQQDKKARGPRTGEVPEIRVEVDSIPPTAELFPPRRDPNKANSLLLVWSANDKNLGTNPVTLEWAERRDGPWFPIGSNLAYTAGAPGKHSWQLPDRLPVQVYLRLRVRDLAGNEGIAITPDPQLVDLSEPEGRLVNVSVEPRRQ